MVSTVCRTISLFRITFKNHTDDRITLQSRFEEASTKSSLPIQCQLYLCLVVFKSGRLRFVYTLCVCTCSNKHPKGLSHIFCYKYTFQSLKMLTLVFFSVFIIVCFNILFICFMLQSQKNIIDHRQTNCLTIKEIRTLLVVMTVFNLNNAVFSSRLFYFCTVFHTTFDG